MKAFPFSDAKAFDRRSELKRKLIYVEVNIPVKPYICVITLDNAGISDIRCGLESCGD
jgi:hypothetical protein